MGFFVHRIELMLEQLSSAIPHVGPTLFRIGNIERNDWRPVWNLCKQIQDEFRESRDFPSREARDAAWNRFQELKSRASELAEREKEAFRDQSQEMRNEIMYMIKGCGYSPLDDIMFFFDPTTVEDMKDRGQRLKAAGRKLSDYKAWMLAEHKTECFQRMQDMRESHEMFWEKRKQLSAERRQANEARRAEFERKREAWEERTKSNIQRNREKLAKAEGARERALDRIRELENKLSETSSDKWQGIYSGWLSEAAAKLSEIESSIDRIEGWIREDESRLYK